MSYSICVCGHERTGPGGHTYDPKDYDRHACLICECPKFEAKMYDRAPVGYPLRTRPPAPTEIRYRESTESSMTAEEAALTYGPSKNWPVGVVGYFAGPSS